MFISDYKINNLFSIIFPFQVTKEDFATFDYILCMDENNLRYVFKCFCVKLVIQSKSFPVQISALLPIGRTGEDNCLDAKDQTNKLLGSSNALQPCAARV